MTDSRSTLHYEPEERGSKVVIRRMAPHYTGSGEVIARHVELHDAQTIVKAVNLHDELVEALNAQEVAENEHANCPDCEGVGDWAECGLCSERFGDAIDIRRAALAKAKANH